MVTRQPRSRAAWMAIAPQPDPISSRWCCGPSRRLVAQARELGLLRFGERHAGAIEDRRTSRSASRRGTTRRTRCRGRNGPARRAPSGAATAAAAAAAGPAPPGRAAPAAERSNTCSALRAISSNRPTRSLVRHSPAMKPSPGPSFPLSASLPNQRSSRISSTIGSQSSDPKRRRSPSGKRSSSAPSDICSSAPNNTRRAIAAVAGSRSGRRTVRASALTPLPIRGRGRRPAFCETGRAFPTGAAPAGGCGP